jgi:hypothetical protein
MIEQVQAFKASDGTVFLDDYAALEYDCEIKLKQCIGKPCSTEIMKKILAVHAAIAPLCSAIMAKAEHKAAEQPANVEIS